MTNPDKALRTPKGVRTPVPPSAASLKFAEYLARRMAPMIESATKQQTPTPPKQGEQ